MNPNTAGMFARSIVMGGSYESYNLPDHSERVLKYGTDFVAQLGNETNKMSL